MKIKETFSKMLHLSVLSHLLDHIRFPECFFGGFHPFVGPHIGPDCGTNGFVHLV